MSITTATIQAMYATARSTFAGASVTIRHNGTEYTGTRLPIDSGEVVDEGGAMFTVSGGVRLLVSELAPVWPKSGDKVDVKSTENSKWVSYVVGPTRLDEMEATMLLQYGEMYDQ